MTSSFLVEGALLPARFFQAAGSRRTTPLRVLCASALSLLLLSSRKVSGEGPAFLALHPVQRDNFSFLRHNSGYPNLEE